MKSTQNEQVKILLVDDLESNLLALEGLLRRADLDIFKVKSGAEALDLMISHEFALTIIDVRMPIMSGFELAELMRAVKKTKNIPIIFVTATATGQNFSFRGYESGAVDFLLKPLDPHMVKSKVNIFIELYRQKMKLEHQIQTITSLLQALNQAKHSAEQANMTKTHFLANMSHEIRTPIAAILGFNHLMKNPANTLAENHNYMKAVDRNSQQLLRLIDDILDLSKVEAGVMTTEIRQFSLVDMLVDFIAIMKLKAEEKGIEFRFNTTTLIPDSIGSDSVRLQQILTNIVGNALKFSDHGYVELNISFTNPILTFTVTDTGIGISKEQESRLFQPFAQADTSTTRKFGGTGLGLVLSRRLAEILGGKLVLVSSQEGCGSTFLVEIALTLPPHAKLVGREALSIIPKTDTTPSANEQKLNLCGLKVLLVEDSSDNQMLIASYLYHEGAQVQSAYDGARGVELALTEDFDVLIMDIQMPILDGHSATKKLRQAKYLKPIIALTAHAMREEREKCLQSGFTEFLTKPVQRELLIEVLSAYVPR